MQFKRLKAYITSFFFSLSLNYETSFEPIQNQIGHGENEIRVSVNSPVGEKMV